jgi:CBS domain-containing protein
VLVADVMDNDPAYVSLSTSFRRAAELFVRHATSELVVTDDGGYVGILSEGDLLRALMPDFESLATSDVLVSLDRATELFLDATSFHADRPIASVVIGRPITLAPGDSLLKAATVMASMHIHRLPVVDDGVVVGMLARADVLWAVLSPEGA